MILALFITHMFFLPDFSFAGNSPKVLVIRPDRLPVKNVSEHSVIPARNPFAWPIDQLQQLEGSDSLKKDPFSDYSLNAIIWTDKDPVAIINNQPFHLGDSFDGVQIITIEKDRVIIANRKTRRTLHFPDPYIELKNSAEADE